MKVSDLEGAELDYWVAMAGGHKAKLSKTHPEHGYIVYEDAVSCWIFRPTWEGDDEYFWDLYEPSWSWHEGGPIIEREKIDLDWDRMNKVWAGYMYLGKPGEFSYEYGPTPLIAAMRAYVSSKFGEEVNGQ